MKISLTSALNFVGPFTETVQKYGTVGDGWVCTLCDKLFKKYRARGVNYFHYLTTKLRAMFLPFHFLRSFSKKYSIKQRVSDPIELELPNQALNISDFQLLSFTICTN